MFTSRFIAFSSLFALAATSPLLPRASADGVVSYYHASDNYGWEISHVPDIDQRRSAINGVIGLPGGGNTYCVPTATLNMMLYAANHGFPNIGPGPGNYELQTQYNTVSIELFVLGSIMGTTTTGGTGVSGWRAGVQAKFPSPDWTVSQYTASGNYTPDLHKMTQIARDGGLLSFGYGRYDVVGQQGEAEVISRDGGHAVTFTKSVKSGPFGLAWCMDPAAPNDGQVTTQSAFDDRLLVVTPRPVIIGGVARTMDALNYNPSADRHAFIDQYIAVRPLGCYGWQNENLGLGQSQAVISFAQPFTITDPNNPSLQQIQIGDPLAALVIDPDQTSLVALTDSEQPLIQVIDLATEEATVAIPAPDDSEALVFGRHRGLYISTVTELHCYVFEEMMPGMYPPDPIASVALPWDPDAMTYDDANDQVVLISFEAGQIALFDRGLGGAPTMLPLNGIPFLSGIGSIAVDPTNGDYWFTASSDTAAYRVQQFASGPPVTNRYLGPQLINPTAVNVDDSGKLLFNVPMTDPNGDVNSEIIAMQVQQGGITGGYFLQSGDTNVWAGLHLGAVARITQSRDNTDPDIHAGPDWNHLPPLELNFADPLFESFCRGDGGNQLGCTDCPCGNNSPQGTHGGCLNEAGQASELLSFGYPSVASDGLRFEVRRANPGTFGVLISGDQRAPANAANPCFGLGSGVTATAFNGLRCVVQGVLRHGSRATDASGDIGSTNNGWGGANGPPQGLIAQGGFVAGQRRHFQVIYRENPNADCVANQNTTQAVTTTFLP